MRHQSRNRHRDDPDDERLRAVSLWSVDPDIARRMRDEDPAVRAGPLAAQVATWMTPAGQPRFERVRVARPWPKSRAEHARPQAIQASVTHPH
jgi:hypothetical protein